MRIALHDADRTRFPNLALMKLAAWHKSRGDEVTAFLPLFRRRFDKIYSSKVFTYTKLDKYLPPDIELGGSGYSLDVELPDEIEHTCPDYSWYGLKYSLGFLTRGCSRKCSYCLVPQKEGRVRAHAEIEEFLRHDRVVLMDNNVLAHEHGLKQIEHLAVLGVKVDFNQGLEARLVDAAVARLLVRVHWIRFIRFACDRRSQMEHVARAVVNLRREGFGREIFAYALVEDDVEEALERVEFLRRLGVEPFAQPYRALDGSHPPRLSAQFARWVNRKAEFKSRSWAEYRKARRI
jgi:pyruvate-formate lyase-activating enzyme